MSRQNGDGSRPQTRGSGEGGSRPQSRGTAFQNEDGDDDDVSSLGGTVHDGDDASLGDEEEKDEKKQNVAGDGSHAGGASIKSADEIDEVELREYLDAHAMIVDGFRCPDEFVDTLTPMEFEELVQMFKRYDVNGSGTIDKHEARKILNELGLDSSLEKAEELLALVDVDGSGEIDFAEYCRFVHLVKSGDERMAQFGGMMDKLKETPLGLLEHQAEMRHLTLRFNLVEVREATAVNPPIYVMELHVTGEWYENKDGVNIAWTGTKKFQSLANNSRDAKYGCAKVALQKLGAMMPGVHSAEGEFPDEWLTWVDENLQRGVDPSKIVAILFGKGFHPYRNLRLMQRVIVWRLFDIFLEKNPNFDVTNTVAVDVNFAQWAKDTLNKGIDGDVVMQILKDRGVTLFDEHIHYSQRIRNNELGSLLDVNGRNAKLFDFWTACADGCVEEVRIFCSAGQSPNQEQVGRYTSEYMYPIHLAAKGGHTQVIKVLLDFNVDINAMDRRGRRAIHHSAAAGHVEASKLLLLKGAEMFVNDFTGNTPLHYAAMYNQCDMISFLCFRGQELTRTITSDKERVRPGVTFDQLAEEVFQEMCDKKLPPSVYRRFEKSWLAEAANLFRAKAHPKVQYMLAPAAEEIMTDVLNRFDPRPEAGALIMNSVSGKQVFIPTIPTSNDLSILLRYVFRQASIDPVNNWRRTPLHLACEMNKLTSHEQAIRLMIDSYGCNVTLRDMHNRRPIDLLIMDREFAQKPSATRVREEVLLFEREKTLKELSLQYAEEEARHTAKRRQHIVDDCAKRVMNPSADLWDVNRQASILRKTYLDYEMYECHDTKNYFFVKKPFNPLEGDVHTDYRWFYPPPHVSLYMHRQIAFIYQLCERSIKLRTVGKWDMYRDKISGLDFFHDPVTDELRYRTPPEIVFRELVRSSTVVGKLGFNNEWDEMKDAYGNTFYRFGSTKTSECFWDRPIDAVDVQPQDKLCSAYQFRNKPRVQRWFSCEQCNRNWKLAGETNLALKICEPCVLRCHVGHRGIRFNAESETLCVCHLCAKSTGYVCCGRQPSPAQIKTLADAYDYRTEIIRKREEVALMPPMFAVCPPCRPDGSPKTHAGWMLFRRPPPKEKRDLENFGQKVKKAKEMNTDIEEGSVGSALDSSIISDTTASTKTGSLIQDSVVELDTVAAMLTTEDFPYVPPAGLPKGWIEVLDSEELDDIPLGNRVLVKMFKGVPYLYGNIVAKINPGFFRVRYDVTVIEEIVERSRIQVISKPVFYCNLETGESAWTIKQAKKNPYPSSSLRLPGKEWADMFTRSIKRRGFEDNFEQYRNPHAGIVLHLPPSSQYLFCYKKF